MEIFRGEIAIEKLTKKELIWITEGVSVEEIDFNSLCPVKSSVIHVLPNHSSPLDSHAVKETRIILNGEGELRINNERKGTVKAGDIVYFCPFETHSVKNVSEEPLKIISLWWE